MHKRLILGQHLLCLRSDGSLEAIAHDEQASLNRAGSGVNLTREETYRLFISLQAQFTRKETALAE
ncbi:MAG TPA: hypothetical protein VGN34_20490 [Ktedonobacteraceae bacterium]